MKEDVVKLKRCIFAAQVRGDQGSYGSGRKIRLVVCRCTTDSGIFSPTFFLKKFALKNIFM